jgi:intein-encoded DNA endonuclease-like protein
MSTPIHKTPALNNRNVAEYISGFVDGEGCFSVSFSKRPRFVVGWETKPSFSVSQNHDRAQPLFIMQKYFGCGFMRDGISDKTLKYEVRRLDDLLEKVLPHFKRFPLLSAKQQDVELLEEVCLLMKKSEHVTPEGIEKILPLAFKMNPSGKRRYTKHDIQSFMKIQMKV